MALYKADKKDRNKQVYDVYASDASKKSIPKYQMPKEPTDPKVMGDLIIDELMMDGNARQNLATFCQTWLDEQTHRIMDACIDKNMIDKDEYPQTAEIENRCVHILADLWNSPSPEDTLGCSTTGSSEAAMLGGLALKWRWRLRRQKEGKPTDKPNIVTGPVQICWHKFARYFDVEIREIPMDHGRLLMTPEEVLKRVDENTIGVVPTLGVTFTGQYEPVKDVCDALDKLQKDTGLDIPVHVDGASGAFLAPFLDPDLLWDFRLPRVKSVNASGHKFGLSPLGVGWVVWREKTDLPEELIFYVNYLGGNMPTFALNFSRPGGQIIAQYYNLLRHGWEGYRHVQQACADHARYFCEQLAKMGPFDIIYNGDGNGIPAGCWKLKPGDHGFTVFDLADRLRIRGWQLPAYTLPANCQDLAIQRILVRHGFSRDMADLLLADIERALAFFKEHPVTKPATEKESGGYHH